MRSRRSRIRSIVTRVVVFLLLGAIVNVAVAWGFALWVDPTEAHYQFGVDRTQPWLWTLARFDALGTTLLFSNRGPDHGAKFPTTGASPRQSAPTWSGLVQPLSDFGGELITDEYRLVDGRGWPVRALTLYCTALRLEGSTAPAISKRWLIDLDPSMSSPIDWGGWATFRRLPLRPLWPGFAINTIFYAAILWLVFAAPGVLRRRRRIKRGLCLACAYPVGTSPVCTECGKPVQQRAGKAESRDVA